MAVQKVIDSNPYRDNGGTVLLGGKIDSTSSTVTNAPAETIIGHHSGQYGTTVPAPGSQIVDTRKAVSGGTFAFVMQEGKYVIRSVTKELGGVANTAILSGSQFFRQSINKLEHTRRLDEDSWDYVTGAVTKGGQQGAKSDYHSITAGSGVTPNDDAANVSRSAPGEFTITEGGLLPSNKDYSAKTG